MTLEHAGIGEADANRKGDWISTYTGKRFHPFDPRPEDVDIRDIAHALALQCRFAGHCSGFYSIAQHSVLVSRHCDPADALWGLLHDASEAYLCDIPKPLKRNPMMRPYREAERDVQATILFALLRPTYLRQGRHASLSWETPTSVHLADATLLRTEARDLMNDPQDWTWPDGMRPLLGSVVSWPWDVAEAIFLDRFRELYNA